MRPKKSKSLKNGVKTVPGAVAEMNEGELRGKTLAAICQYTPPQYKEYQAFSCIEMYAFHPVKNRMERWRMKLTHIQPASERKRYARELVKRFNAQLLKGWNPFIAKDFKELATMEDAYRRYSDYLDRMLAGAYYRKETYAGYKSGIKVLRDYSLRQAPITYLYQFDRTYCVDFLDWIFITKNRTAQTRNNYLTYLRHFSGFLVEKGLLKSKPTADIKNISKRLYAKQRKVMPLTLVTQISEWLREHDPRFLFVCNLVYYCFIRPVEITRLKVGDFALKEGVVTIPADASKNKYTQSVTVPRKVMRLGIELGIFSAPSTDYVVSAKGLAPGPVQIDPKLFRDHWARVRYTLKFDSCYQFYSLKDTGITALLDQNVVPIDVRDQARHSSLEITNLYTRHTRRANPDILNQDGAL